MNDVKKIMQINEIQKKASKDRSALVSAGRRMQSIVDEIKAAAEIEYTGWFVLLKVVDGGFESLGTFNPDLFDEDDDIEPEWDLCLPIPKPETFPEFKGW